MRTSETGCAFFVFRKKEFPAGNRGANAQGQVLEISDGALRKKRLTCTTSVEVSDIIFSGPSF